MLTSLLFLYWYILYLCASVQLCASVNNNNVLSEDVKMTESLFLLGKCLFFVVAYINMINDTRNLT